MNKILFFWQEKCPNCHHAMNVLEQLNKPYTPIDIDDVQGMSEAAFYGVMGTPTIIIVDEDYNEVESFRAVVPLLSDLEFWFQST